MATCEPTPAYTGRDKPYTGRDGLYTPQTGKYTPRTGLYAKRDGLYSTKQFCAILLQENTYPIILQDGYAIKL